MNYLKFNCYDMADENARIYSSYRKMRSLAEALSEVFRTSDPQVKSYDSICKAMAETEKKSGELAVRLLAAHNALDQVTDRYYAAEKKASELSRELPAGIMKPETAPAAAKPRIRKATINNNNLILEDWLAELIYKLDINEGDG